MASAALVNGITSHTFDFDDTHLKTIIHPAGPVASALLALAEVTGPRAGRWSTRWSSASTCLPLGN
jgi:2-methylcitrate dehydratase PrpD